MTNRLLVAALVVTVLTGVSCSSGTFAFPPGAVANKRLVTDYYSNGNMKDRGYVGIDASGQEVKTDQWQWWYDNGQLQWQGYYLDGVVDPQREWQEWNRNGSLRDTWIDN